MDRLQLVNKETPIKQKQMDKINKISIQNIEEEKIQVEEETYKAFLELQKDLKKQGMEIGIISAYRSLEDQQETKDFYMEKYGEIYCEKYIAPVGCSEHHTGQAIDFYIKKDGAYPKDDNIVLEHPEDYEIIHPILKKYGFILRYPKGKEKITGYAYEPWHIRYVGKFIANIIEEKNITLEEYLNTFQGVVVVRKEKGMTSFDVVHEISKLYGIKKVGHTGTLDPLAEGVLIVCVGAATKIVELLTAYDKEYIAGVQLGIKTDTYDIEGKIIEEKEVPKDINIEEVLKSFQKTYLQEVPIYSAVKVDGKKLYEYARENKEVSLPKKEVTIKQIELLEQKEKTFKFRSKVSKGCYIRSLINDIGNSLNTNATMTSLIRTKQGTVSLEEAYTLDQIKKGEAKLYSLEKVLDYPIIKVEEELEFKIKNGVKIPNKWKIEDKVVFKNKNNKLLGVYQKKDDFLIVWKNFQ